MHLIKIDKIVIKGGWYHLVFEFKYKFSKFHFNHVVEFQNF